MPKSFSQTHLGDLATEDCNGLNAVWTSNDGEDKYWCGHWYQRTPEQLKKECLSTLRDLAIHHPEVFK